MLRFYDDMTEPEVAAALGVSVGTVKSAVAPAVTKLRQDAELGADSLPRPREPSLPPPPSRAARRTVPGGAEMTAGSFRGC